MSLQPKTTRNTPIVETVKVYHLYQGRSHHRKPAGVSKGKMGMGGVAARNGLQLDNLGNGLRRWESCIYWMLSEKQD